MTLIEMKASAYDLLAQIQFLESKLKETNQLIEQKINEEKADG
jgi:hypothetical protein